MVLRTFIRALTVGSALGLISCVSFHGPTGDDAYRLTCCQCEDETPTEETTTRQEQEDRPSRNYEPPVTPSRPPAQPPKKKEKGKDDPMPGKVKKHPRSDTRKKEKDVRPPGRHVKPGSEKKTPTPY